MAIQACRFLYLLFLSIFGTGVFFHLSPESIKRSNFPSDFVFGTSTSAFQVEGASREGGKGHSIWDTFTEKHPDKVKDGSNATVAVDFYHRFKDDVKTMKDLGVGAYRFSISWARILPNGKISGGINREGVQYYNNLINELKSKGLEPFVTLFHWDVPQALEDQYGSFLSPLIVDDFKNYAELCFKLFGDRVKHWMTINEPLTFSVQGYSDGTGAPGRCSPWVDIRCESGDSGREPYIVAHHQLLAHATVFKLYKDKYQVSQNGKMGIILNCHYFLPYSNTKSDMDAVDRANDFMFGWYLEPLTQGEYPINMRTIVRDRLPQFTVEQSNMVKGSFDFIGINYYSTNYIKSNFTPWNNNISYDHDTRISWTGMRNGIPIGPAGASPWLFVYPPGLKGILLYINNRYNKPVIYITENGVDENNDPTMKLETALEDNIRVDYYKGHLNALMEALREGVKVKGYFAWTLFDNFEWADGYTVRFGLYYVDFNSLMRYPKSSAIWFQNFLKS